MINFRLKEVMWRPENEANYIILSSAAEDVCKFVDLTLTEHVDFTYLLFIDIAVNIDK